MSAWEDTYQESLSYIIGKNLDENAKGHVWKRDDIVYPDGYVPPDDFAYGGGYHNGPECASCGYDFCIHCTSIKRITKCPHPNPALLDALSSVVKIRRTVG